jgi:hypothetical protein
MCESGLGAWSRSLLYIALLLAADIIDVGNLPPNFFFFFNV